MVFDSQLDPIRRQANHEVNSGIDRPARILAGIVHEIEEQLHRQIHQWLSSQQYIDVEVLNARVYPQLFLMPLDDPWLGLRPFAYSALDGA